MSLTIPNNFNISKTIKKDIPVKELPADTFNNIKIPKYSKDTTDCPHISLKGLFDTSGLPKFDIDLPDWKLGNLHALDKVGNFFKSLDMPSLPSFKLNGLKTNGMFDSFKCLSINGLKPDMKDLKFKQNLKNLNNINCNSLSMFNDDNSAINSALFKALMSASNCDKTATVATKGSMTDLTKLASDKGLSNAMKTSLTSAAIAGNIDKKFSVDAAKNVIQDPKIKNLYKSAFNKFSNPGSKMHVSKEAKKASIGDKESTIGFATSLSSNLKLSGKNELSKLAKSATKDSMFHADISKPLASINDSQKINIFSKIKNAAPSNKFIHMVSKIA